MFFKRPQNLERDTVHLINQFRVRLQDQWLDGCIEYAKHSEWGLALEMLCEQLFEFDIVPEQTELNEIIRLGRKMGIDPKYWQPWADV